MAESLVPSIPLLGACRAAAPWQEAEAPWYFAKARIRRQNETAKATEGQHRPHSGNACPRWMGTETEECIGTCIEEPAHSPSFTAKATDQRSGTAAGNYRRDRSQFYQPRNRCLVSR